MMRALGTPATLGARIAAFFPGARGKTARRQAAHLCRCGWPAAPGCTSCDTCHEGALATQRTRRRAEASATPGRRRYRCSTCQDEGRPGLGHNAQACPFPRARAAF